MRSWDVPLTLPHHALLRPASLAQIGSMLPRFFSYAYILPATRVSPTCGLWPVGVTSTQLYMRHLWLHARSTTCLRNGSYL